MIGSHFQYVLIYHNVINYNWWIPNAYGWFSMNVEKPNIWSIFPVQIFLYILYSHILSIVKNQLSWSGFTYSHTLSIIPFCVYIYIYVHDSPYCTTGNFAGKNPIFPYVAAMLQLSKSCMLFPLYIYIYHIIILLGIILVGIASYLYIYLFPHGGFLKSR